jgi:drug/metabolite transporter (DMT)-like permease
MPPGILPWALLARVCLSVTSSGLQKRRLQAGIGTDTFWLGTYGWMLPAGLLVLLAGWQPAAGATFWTNAAAAGVLDVAGNLVMLVALRGTDLSVFGPLTALRPVLALLFGWLFLSEKPSGGGFGGLAITAAGAVLLLSKPDTSGEPMSGAWKTLSLRIGGLALSTLGSVFLKRAAITGTPEMTLGVWIITGWLTLVGGSLVLRRIRSSKGDNRITGLPSKSLLLHAVVFFVMQWLTIHVFRQSLLAYSFAFFQIGMVLQVIVGCVFFNEPAFGKRLTGCLVMSAGAALIAWRG